MGYWLFGRSVWFFEASVIYGNKTGNETLTETGIVNEFNCYQTLVFKENIW